ncbi:hypothetical protein PR048_008177 [Dryococelus australis]|uniref:Uncharacterized protein n=1 Tax=Dryococelus australis TaxID=614101 RepID=A0ABQ9HX89_9NEOP|nr:hypothetical protein PR048_008177 [Dryococelus australis]
MWAWPHNSFRGRTYTCIARDNRLPATRAPATSLLYFLCFSLLVNSPNRRHGDRVSVRCLCSNCLFKLSATVGHTGGAALKHVATHMCKGFRRNELIPRVKWCGKHRRFGVPPQPEVRWCGVRYVAPARLLPCGTERYYQARRSAHNATYTRLHTRPCTLSLPLAEPPAPQTSGAPTDCATGGRRFTTMKTLIYCFLSHVLEDMLSIEEIIALLPGNLLVKHSRRCVSYTIDDMEKSHQQGPISGFCELSGRSPSDTTVENIREAVERSHKAYHIQEGTTVAERLARSPPNKAQRVQSPAGSPNFCKWESCRTMPLVSRSSRGSPVSLAPSFRHRSIFTSITLISS